MFEHLTIRDINKRILTNAIDDGHLSHSYMFIGPEGTYKKKTALEFVKAILCQGIGNEKPCNVCTSCSKIAHNNHPDVTLINPIENSIKIHQVREMQRVIRIKPYESAMKFLIIDHCETMGIPAQNALLKSLEDPSKAAMIILLCYTKDKILPTILSRCQQLTFYPVNKSEFWIYAQKYGVCKDDAQDYYALTQGCVGKLETIIGDPDIIQGFRRTKDFVEKIVAGQTHEIFTFSKWIKECKYAPLEITTYIIIILRDLLYDIITNENRNTTISKRLSYNTLNDIITDMADIQASISNNINLQLQIERILLKIQEEINNYDKSSWNKI